MELESFIFTLSIFLEILGGASIIACTSGKRCRNSGAAEIVLIGCVCGLGSVTIVGAMLHLFCGLIAGVAVVVMGVAVVFLAERSEDENPLARLPESPIID